MKTLAPEDGGCTVTYEELKSATLAALPERLRSYPIVGPFTNLTDANLQAAYFMAAYQELIGAYEKQADMKRQFLTEEVIALALQRMIREELNGRRFRFVPADEPGLRMITELLEFDDVELTATLQDFAQRNLLIPVKALVAKIGDATCFSRLPQPGGVDMKGLAEDWFSCFSVRLVRAYDIRGNSRPVRLDALIK